MTTLRDDEIQTVPIGALGFEPHADADGDDADSDDSDSTDADADGADADADDADAA